MPADLFRGYHCIRNAATAFKKMAYEERRKWSAFESASYGRERDRETEKETEINREKKAIR